MDKGKADKLTKAVKKEFKGKITQDEELLVVPSSPVRAAMWLLQLPRVYSGGILLPSIRQSHDCIQHGGLPVVCNVHGTQLCIRVSRDCVGYAHASSHRLVAVRVCRW